MRELTEAWRSLREDERLTWAARREDAREAVE
jgi:hypothetical protein